MAKAIIFAAGLGTRLKPITDTIPKALVEVANKSLLEHAVAHLCLYGVTDIVVNVHHHAQKVIDKAKKLAEKYPCNITISDESDKVLETGGGLKKAAHLLQNEPYFIAYNVDILSDLNLALLVNFHLENKNLSSLVVRSRKTNRYFLFNEKMDLCGWKNMANNEIKLSSTKIQRLIPYAFSGIQVISSEMLPLLLYWGEVFSITDAYIKLCAFYKIQGFVDKDSFWMDIGTPEKLQEANRIRLV
ncbi:MAG: nucleotidyltransferase family protein [Bacteroidales bacterium]|nr:nucleotidyltransferase family protein [Bacteroidales bacterium]